MKKYIKKSAPFILTITMGIVLLPGLTGTFADEGMWTFDNPPLKQWKERYNFEPSKDWLDHSRLSTVRLSEGGGGGTGCFVSPDGLVMTNQHVGRSQVSKLSTGGRDLVRDGFYADTREGELRCTDLEINVLIAYENVTDRVQNSVKAVASDKEAAALRKSAITEIEKTAAGEPGIKAEVVTLYNGGEYWLYRFKRYTDVRLVFSVEEQAAYFGGDYDNFTYPRYCLDITFFRVYENGSPARTDHYLKWSENGPVEGELVIVPGFPGSTARLLTAAQLKYQRDTGNPLQMQVWSSRRDALKKYAERGPEQARQASPLRLSLENSIKRLIGQQAGLENPRIFQKKEADEESLRKQIASRADWQKEYSDAWPVIERAYNSLPAMAKRISFSNLTASRLGTLASNFVRLGEEITRPNGERYEEFRDNRLDSLKLSMLSKAPIYPELEMAVLTSWLEEASKALGGDDPFVRAVLGGKSPAEAVKSAVSSSRLPDPAYRQSLLNGGPDQIARSISQSDDPMLDMARRIEPVIRRLRAWQEENIQNIETRANEKIARARFAVYGKNLYPDANFNLRITYGTVAGYEEDTTLVPYKTTFYGLYDRAISFGEKAPYHLPARFKERREKVNLQTPLDFVYSADTIGGNSGSPVINRRGELVGINFDSNIQKLPNRYLYIDENEGARAVGVHSSAIIEALNNVYGAGLLVRELLGR